MVLLANLVSVMRSTFGSFRGEGAKFRPLASTSVSGFVRDLLDRFFTHLSWMSVDVASLGLVPRCVGLVSVL